MWIVASRMVLSRTILSDQAIQVQAGRITAIEPAREIPPHSATRHLPLGSLLAPGLLDLQINGGGGRQFNAEPTPDTIRAMANAAETGGATSILPTLITASRAVMDQAAHAFREAIRCGGHPAAAVMGLHFEGPFLNPLHAGVHNPAWLRPMEADDEALLVGLAAEFPQHRFLLTLAPEMVQDDAIARLSAAGVIVAAGHTAASPARIAAARHHGLRGFTHLFNAMPPLRSRDPGPVGACLSERDSWCGVITDGIHVNPTALRATIAAKTSDRVFLVSDAMAVLGTGLDRFELDGRTIFRRDGALRTPDGALAGADLDMIGAVRYAITHLGVDAATALRMASDVPAVFMGLPPRRIAVGLPADLIVISDSLRILDVMRDGRFERLAA